MTKVKSRARRGGRRAVPTQAPEVSARRKATHDGRCHELRVSDVWKNIGRGRSIKKTALRSQRRAEWVPRPKHSADMWPWLAVWARRGQPRSQGAKQSGIDPHSGRWSRPVSCRKGPHSRYTALCMVEDELSACKPLNVVLHVSRTMLLPSLNAGSVPWYKRIMWTT